MAGLDEQHNDPLMPSMISKDDLAITLLVNTVKEIKHEQKSILHVMETDNKEMKKALGDHIKDFNEFKLAMQPFITTEAKAFNKLMGLNADEVSNTIHWVKNIRNLNQVLVPLVFFLFIGFAILGLREYASGHHDDVPFNQIPKTNTEFLIPDKHEWTGWDEFIDFNKEAIDRHGQKA
jgi:hypothetical protein